MKINLGLSLGEKIEAKKRWHYWFAWYPVRVGYKDYRWLETVERRGFTSRLSGRMGFKYREKNLFLTIMGRDEDE